MSMYYHENISSTRLLLHVRRCVALAPTDERLLGDSSHKSYDYPPKSLHPSPDTAGAQDQCLTHVMTPNSAHSKVQSLLRRPIQMHGTAHKTCKPAPHTRFHCKTRVPTHRTTQPSTNFAAQPVTGASHAPPLHLLCCAARTGRPPQPFQPPPSRCS